MNSHEKSKLAMQKEIDEGLKIIEKDPYYSTFGFYHILSDLSDIQKSQVVYKVELERQRKLAKMTGREISSHHIINNGLSENQKSTIEYEINKSLKAVE